MLLEQFKDYLMKDKNAIKQYQTNSLYSSKIVYYVITNYTERN